MISRKIFSIIVAFVAIFVILSPAATAQEPIRRGDSPAFVPGEVLVKFKPGLGVQDTRQRVAGLQVSRMTHIPAVDAVQLHVPEGQEQAVISSLRARSDVVYVEPNYIAYALDTPNDPFFYSQWGLSKINLPQGLDIISGSSDITIAIIDTGIDLDHPDFSCQVGPGLSKLTAGQTFVFNTSTPDDDNSHGTHAAGIAGACTDNGLGVSGVAPDVRLMPVKVLDAGGSGTYLDVANGIVYAVDNGADIINLSLGGSIGSSVLANAVQYAASRNVLMVAASGNAGQGTIFYPAAYPEVMAVGATTSSDFWASYSNYGSGLDVVAPGSSIYNTVTGGSYDYKSGTSMATPHVAGLAALIRSFDPSLTPTEIRQAIQSTAEDLGDPGYDIFYGYGRIDAFRALENFLVISLLQTSGQAQTGPVSFLVDDQLANPLPSTYTLDITTNNQNFVDWQATLNPDVSWLSIVSPSSGQISAFSSDQITLSAARPPTYGIYTTQLNVTGVTPSGAQLGPVTADIELTYLPELYRLRFPIIFKN